MPKDPILFKVEGRSGSEIRIQHQNPSGGDREPLVSPEGTGVFIPRTPGETSEPDEQGESQDTAESDDTD